MIGAPRAETTETPLRAEIRATVALAAPLVVAQVAQLGLRVTDLAMAGALGVDALAGMALAGQLVSSVELVGVGVLAAVAPLVAQAIGRGDPRDVRRSARQGLWVAILLGTAFAALYAFARSIFAALGLDPVASAEAALYVDGALWAFLAIMPFTALRQVMAAHGHTRAVMLIVLAGLAANAVANAALMYGWWGFPRLELYGGGLATSIVALLMMLLAGAFCVLHPDYRAYRLFARFWRPDWRRFAEIWRVGAPIGLMVGCETFMFAAAAIMMTWVSAAALAAHGVAVQLAGIAFMVPLAIGQAATVRVGLRHGAGDGPGSVRAGWTALGIGLGASALFAALFLVAPRTLASIYLDVEAAGAVAALVAAYLVIAAVFQLSDAAQVIAASALRGYSDTTRPMVIAIASYWLVGAPLGYALAFWAGFDGVGVWLGLAAGLSVAALLLTARFSRRAAAIIRCARSDAGAPDRRPEFSANS